VIVVAVADELIWTTHFANSDDLLAGARPIEELGWPIDMTVSKVMRTDSAAGCPRRVLLPTV
jgi:hypothetical protein